jgi:glc operon protein GlcG
VRFERFHHFIRNQDQAQAVIHAAAAEAKKRDWKMNVAVADSGGNVVAF